MVQDCTSGCSGCDKNKVTSLLTGGTTSAGVSSSESESSPDESCEFAPSATGDVFCWIPADGTECNTNYFTYKK